VDVDATEQEVREAVRSRQLETHPDKQRGASARGKRHFAPGVAARRFRHVAAAAAAVSTSIGLERARSAARAGDILEHAAVAPRGAPPPRPRAFLSERRAMRGQPYRISLAGYGTKVVGSASGHGNTCPLHAVMQQVDPTRVPRLHRPPGDATATASQLAGGVEFIAIHEKIDECVHILKDQKPLLWLGAEASFIEIKAGVHSCPATMRGADLRAFKDRLEDERLEQLDGWDRADRGSRIGTAVGYVTWVALSVQLQRTIVVVEGGYAGPAGYAHVFGNPFQFAPNGLPPLFVLHAGNHFVPLWDAPGTAGAATAAGAAAGRGANGNRNAAGGNAPDQGNAAGNATVSGNAATGNAGTENAAAGGARAEPSDAADDADEDQGTPDEGTRSGQPSARGGRGTTRGRPRGSRGRSGQAMGGRGVMGGTARGRGAAAGPGRGRGGVAARRGARDDADVACDVCSSLESSAADEMLTCSRFPVCRHGRHLRCCNPPLTAVPTGTWFCCLACAQPAPQHRAPRRGGPSVISAAMWAALAQVDAVEVLKGGVPSTLTHIPIKSRAQLAGLYAVAGQRMGDAPGDLAAHNCVALMAHLLLAKPRPTERRRGRRDHDVVNARFKRLISGDVDGLLAYASLRVAEQRYGREMAALGLAQMAEHNRKAALREHAVAKADRLAGVGEISKALGTLEQEPRPSDESVIAKMGDLYSRPAGRDASDAVKTYVHGTDVFGDNMPDEEKEELALCVRDSLLGSKRSAPGPDGVTAEHLCDLVLDYPEANEALMTHVRLVANGYLPEPALRCLRLSRLCGIAKPLAPDAAPEAVPGIRGIAIPQIMRRLVGKVLFRHNLDEITTAVGPTQLYLAQDGIATGYNAALLKLQSTIGSRCICLLDIADAFPSVERADGLEKMLATVPSMIPFVRSIYAGAAPGELIFTDSKGVTTTWTSTQGCDQGDPVAGAFFGMAFRAPLEDVGAAFPDVLSQAFADDMPLVGSTALVSSAVHHILRPGGPLAKANLRINTAKTVVWSPSALSEAEKAAFPPGVKFVSPDDGVVLWGAPLGTDAFILRHLAKEGAKRLAPAQRGAALSDLLVQNVLMCSRMGVNARFDNFLRLIPPRLLRQSAIAWDVGMKDHIERVLGARLSAEAAVQLTLPVRDGGLGYASKIAVMEAAYLAAWLSSRENINAKFPQLHAELARVGTAAASPPNAGGLVAPPDARDAGVPSGSASPGSLERDLQSVWAHVVGTNDANKALLADMLKGLGLAPAAASPGDAEESAGSGRGGPGLQRRLSKNIHLQTLATLTAGACPRYKALLLSSKGPGASGFLTALRGVCEDLQMPDAHMRVACQFRLGLTLSILADADLVGGQCPKLECSRATADGGREYVAVPSTRCTGVCDGKGDHVLGCKRGARGRIGRHDSLVYVLRRIFKEHGATVTTSKSELAEFMRRFDVPGQPPSTHYTPDGRAVWADGTRETVWDNAIVGFNAAANASSEPGASVRHTEQVKVTKYASALRAQPPVIDAVVPFVQDSAGQVGPAALKLLKALAKRRASHVSAGHARQEEDAKRSVQYMLQALGVALMRYQADVLLRAVRCGQEARTRGPQYGWSRHAWGQGWFDGSWAATFSATPANYC
jgi:hypothetical protein